MQNPYAAPRVPHEGVQHTTDENTAIVISGQKRLIYAVLGYLCCVPLLVGANAFLGGTAEHPVVTPAFGVVLGAGLLGILTAAICACTGIFRMGSVLFPGSTRYLYAIGVLIPVPLVGLIVMLVANSNATGYLKARGITVGFFGAKQ